MPYDMSLSSLFSEDIINTVFGSITDPLRIVDRDFRLLWTNREQESHIGRICYEEFDFDAPCSDCPIVPVFRTGRANVREKQLTALDGSIRWNEVRAYPVFGNDDKPQMVVTIGRDITEKKNTEAAAHLQKKDHTLKLTGRQAEVLKLVAEGLTNTEIASELCISPHTVKRHIANLFDILNVNDRTQAAILAVKYGLI